MCEILEVSCSSFYYWLSAPEPKRARKRVKLVKEIKAIHKSSHNTYGSPRIAAELSKRGQPYSRSYIARVMKAEGIRSKLKRKYRVTTDSKHTYPIAENLLQRDFSADGLSQKWVGDITYIRTNEGWLYLTAVIDLADRKVIGWSFSENLTAKNTTVAALKMAVKNRKVNPGLIFHSDRGVQYACNEFKAITERYKITQSMSRKGDCWDNAVAESFFKTLKYELVQPFRFRTKELARLKIFAYIEVFYNNERTHSSLGYLTPNEMEIILMKLSAMAA